MNRRKQRAKQVKRVEKIIAKALDKDWTLEEVVITDNRENGFSVMLTLTYDRYDSDLKGVI